MSQMPQSFDIDLPRADKPVAAAQALSLPRPLTEKDAIDIWIARWLRIRRKDLLARYGCDPRRLYEIWEESRFPSARAKAIEQFRLLHPGLVDRIDYGRHQRISRTVHPDQLGLFE